MTQSGDESNVSLNTYIIIINLVFTLITTILTGLRFKFKCCCGECVALGKSSKDSLNSPSSLTSSPITNDTPSENLKHRHSLPKSNTTLCTTEEVKDVNCAPPLSPTTTTTAINYPPSPSTRVIASETEVIPPNMLFVLAKEETAPKSITITTSPITTSPITTTSSATTSDKVDSKPENNTSPITNKTTSVSLTPIGNTPNSSSSSSSYSTTSSPLDQDNATGLTLLMPNIVTPLKNSLLNTTYPQVPIRKSHSSTDIYDQRSLTQTPYTRRQQLYMTEEQQQQQHYPHQQHKSTRHHIHHNQTSPPV